MLRTLAKTAFLVLLLLGGSAGLFFYYNHNSAQQQIEQLQQKNQVLEQIRHRLETDRRVARILVTGQRMMGGQLKTTLLFVEYTAGGVELPAKQFTIDGNEAHFDAQIIKFKDEYVESGDPLRGRSILLFVRVYGADQAPMQASPSTSRVRSPKSTAAPIRRSRVSSRICGPISGSCTTTAMPATPAESAACTARASTANSIPATSTRSPCAGGDGTINEEPLDPMYKQAIENR